MMTTEVSVEFLRRFRNASWIDYPKMVKFWLKYRPQLDSATIERFKAIGDVYFEKMLRYLDDVEIVRKCGLSIGRLDELQTAYELNVSPERKKQLEDKYRFYSRICAIIERIELPEFDITTYEFDYDWHLPNFVVIKEKFAESFPHCKGTNLYPIREGRSVIFRSP